MGNSIYSQGVWLYQQDDSSAFALGKPELLTRTRKLVFEPLCGTMGLIDKELGMIESFRDRWLRKFFIEDVRSKKIPADLEARLFRKLQMLDDASCDADLRAPPSNRFEKLAGHLAGHHSIRVNKQWRLIFRWDPDRGAASDLYLDNHSYR